MSYNVCYATYVMKSKVHFVGIGGIGVSALARYFLAQNWAVSGSDLQDSSITQELRREGIKTLIGHDKAHLGPEVGLVIHSQAIPLQNPELVEARHLNIPIATYPEALGALTAEHKTIAVAGSHGKSTTTALIAKILIEAGFDPTVIVGTKLRDFGNKNFRLGGSNWLVIEADEYREAFRHYEPDTLVITNVDREHLDYYRNLQSVQKAFLNFAGNLKDGGIMVANNDDPGLRAIKSEFPAGTIWYSLQSRVHLKLIARLEKALKILGGFNLSNSLAAALAARSLGIDDNDILRAVSSYRGAWRRMEYKGAIRIAGHKIKVFDDYAHHPTEIKATLSALREHSPKAQLICVFQPHQLHRLKVLFNDFRESFDKVDALILLDAYKVTGRDAPALSRAEVSHNVSAAKLARAIAKNKKHPEVVYLPHREDLKGILKSIIKSSKTKSSIVVMMGAGDIADITPRLLEHRGARYSSLGSLAAKRK